MTTDNEIELSVEGLAPNHELAKVEGTTQLDSRRITRNRGQGKAIRPPYNPDRLASFLELNETHAMAVRKKARWEVGFGFDLSPRDDPTRDEDEEFEPSEEQKQTLQEFWFGEDSRWLAGPEGTEPTTPTEVLELARQDYHSVGWLALEILTQNDGTPIGLAHVPARTVRVRGTEQTETDDEGMERVVSRSIEKGYVQVRDGATRYFGEAGDRYEEQPIFVDAETGEIGEDVQTPANELIFMRNPSPLEDHYGVPDWISAIRTIVTDESAKDYNRDFFEFDTIPRMVVWTTHPISEQSRNDLREFVHEMRGAGHRTVVIEPSEFLAPEDRDLLDEDDFDITIEPLGQGVSEEMSFQALREANEHDIAKVHEVPPILINVTESSNRANSKEQIHSFATETIAPEASKFAGRLWEILHKVAFDAPDWVPDFVLKGGDLPDQDASLAEKKIRAVNGAIPVNWALQAAGWDPLPDEHPVDGETTLLSELGQSGAPEPGQFGNAAGDRHEHAPPPENKIGERDWAFVKEQLEKDPIETMAFNSSNLDEGLFDFGEQELYLSFLRDEGQSSLYAYVNVPTSEWQGLANAGSHGSYHYDNIRLDYPYVEITNFHSRLPEGPAPDPDDVPEGVPGGI